MSFAARPDPDEHEAAQEAVRAARDRVHAARERAADGHAEAHEVATAEYQLDTALSHLARVQHRDPSSDR